MWIVKWICCFLSFWAWQRPLKVYVPLAMHSRTPASTRPLLLANTNITMLPTWCHVEKNVTVTIVSDFFIQSSLTRIMPNAQLSIGPKPNQKTELNIWSWSRRQAEIFSWKRKRKNWQLTTDQFHLGVSLLTFHSNKFGICTMLTEYIIAQKGRELKFDWNYLYVRSGYL